MAQETDDMADDYLRGEIIISERPDKPLQGKVVAIRTNTQLEFNYKDDALGKIVTRANELHDISSYSKDFRLGMIYFSLEAQEPVGVSWEQTPQPRSEQDLSEPVNDLPDDLIPIEELPPIPDD